MIPEHGSQDAVKFLADMVANRQYVRPQLQRILDAQAKMFLADHPTHVYQEGEYVWYRCHDKAKITKLHMVWTGPGMIMQRMGRNQYRVKTERDQEVVFGSMRVEPLILMKGEQDQKLTPPLHYYSDSRFLVESDTYILGNALNHREVGKGKNE